MLEDAVLRARCFFLAFLILSNADASAHCLQLGANKPIPDKRTGCIDICNRPVQVLAPINLKYQLVNGNAVGGTGCSRSNTGIRMQPCQFFRAGCKTATHSESVWIRDDESISC